MRFLRTEYRALAIFSLRFPETQLEGFVKFDDKQLDLGNIPPDILSLGQHVIEITGLLTACYTFTAVTFALVISFLQYST